MVQYGVSARPSTGGAAGRGARVEHHAAAGLEGLAADLDRARDRSAGRGRARSARPASTSRSTATWSSQPSVASSLMRFATTAKSGRDLRGAGEVADPAGLGQGVRGPDDHLAGDAAVVGALTAHEPLVDPDDVETRLRQLGRRRLTTGSEADHHHVARRHAPESGTPPEDGGTSTVVVTAVTEGRSGVEPKPNPGSGLTGASAPRSSPRQRPRSATTACRSEAP